MTYDEQAVVCEQLAGMLRAGMPLPEALTQVAGVVSLGSTRMELERMRNLLAQGVPVIKAVADSKLPGMLGVILRQGAASGQMAETLHHYAQLCSELSVMQGRLRQALSYPAMIFLVAMLASVVVSVGLWLINPFFRQLFDAMLDGGRLPLLTQVVLGPRWLVASAPVVLLMPVAVLAVLVATAKRWRAWARWKWPVWREISLMQFASSMALLLGHGVRLDDAVTVLQQQEKGTVLGGELARWQADLAGGKSDFVRIAFPSDVLPLFFMGLVSTGGGDLAAGFRVATDVYREMAYCKLDRVLNVFVPVLVVLAYLHVLLPIAAMIFGLFLPLVELMSCLC